MAGIIELETLLKTLSPELQDGEFVFCTVAGALCDYTRLNPVATFVEKEGLTLILPLGTAEEEGLAWNGTYRQITLGVHSSLDAIGLTAVVSKKLTSQGISANIVAACYHDHIFVQKEKAEIALNALRDLSVTPCQKE
ncbi:transporter [candidate division KSB3 bacterium]|uniref:Transporter n=1 Tax=candidate division KSB3 bacterium TaxID=2044937 RepID=A0A2G6E1Y0_9BACT|nr:MAG: transporter [candidate division KSB3 bacterium]PIE28791.1 MAG: transporter [candidate division KSB3 bacterium]